MYLADDHMHSKYSFDGTADLEAICEQAIARGLSEIAITDHMDIFTDLPYGQMINFDVPGGQLFQMDVKGLYTELAQVKEKYAGRLAVKAGAELGQPQVNPAQAEAFLRDFSLDFVIGSIHNMEKDLDVYYYDFSQLDAKAVYAHYIDWLMVLAKTGDFDVMGHLTYPLRYLYEREGIRLETGEWEDCFRTLFKCLIEKGRGIELNISGMYRPMQETMPPFELLKLYRSCGGEIITIGSDAHHTEHIGLYQKEAREMLRQAGFRYHTTFTGRKPDFHAL